MTAPPRDRRNVARLLAALGFVAALGGVAVAAVARPAVPPSRNVALASLETVSLPDLVPGEEIVLKGSVRTTFDGTVYDAVSRTDVGPAGPVVRRDGLFDPETSGFRVASHDPVTHEVRLVVTGTASQACAARGIPAPCLVPKIKEAALERLLTEAELRATLQGSLSADLPIAKPPAVAPGRVAGLAAIGLGLLVALLGVVALVAGERATAIAAVHRAAKKALRELGGDRAHATLRAKIDTLLAHAEKLDRAREKAAARLQKLDIRALEEKTRRLANEGASADAKGWAEKELAAALEVEADYKKALVGLERVESALGVVALSSREERGVRVDAAVADALAEIEDELALREAALAETDDLLRKSP